MQGLIVILMLGVAGVGGWLFGTIHPAPPALMDQLHVQSIDEGIRNRLAGVDLKSLSAALTPTQMASLRDNVLSETVAAGRAIMIDHEPGQDQPVEVSYTPSAPPVSPTRPSTAPPPPPVSTGAQANKAVLELGVSLCPRMTVSNAPAFNATTRMIANYAPIVRVNGVSVAANPTHAACLSSGFGARGSSVHKGVDYYSETGGPIYAAGDGTVVEMKYRDDYGNMLLIDHGNGVYTRYAHLSAFQKGLAAGAKVKAGDQIGLMGNTASYPIPIHLHYELLLGNYANPKASFGLEPHSVYEYKA
jgi:murein DD-endopeptidase MepM/ murein hydrolase activator NlpD